MAHVESRYLDFQPAEMRPGHKTQWVAVYSKRGPVLGYIEWFGPWRQYTFNPAPDTTFNNGCLREIADYCEQLNKEHRTGPAASTREGDTDGDK